MGMYEEEAYRLEESMFRFENMIDTTPTISSIAQFMKLEIKLVGFKYMPFASSASASPSRRNSIHWRRPMISVITNSFLPTIRPSIPT